MGSPVFLFARLVLHAKRAAEKGRGAINHALSTKEAMYFK